MVKGFFLLLEAKRKWKGETDQDGFLFSQNGKEGGGFPCVVKVI